MTPLAVTVASLIMLDVEEDVFRNGVQQIPREKYPDIESLSTL